MIFRGVITIAPMTYQVINDGCATHGLRNELVGISIDPFIYLDDFHMFVSTFRPHPHAGFSAVTYMFEDSRGSILNRNSMGDSSRINPGDLHWSQAASGMMHEQVPEFQDTYCHGLQMFVTLSEENKLKPPRCFHLNSAEIPEIKSDDVRTRVLCGESNGLVSPMNGLLTPITLLDIHLKPGKTFIHEIPQNHFALAIMLKGDIGIDNGETSTPVSNHHAIAFDHVGDAIKIVGGTAGAQLIFGSGVPTGRPNVWS